MDDRRKRLLFRSWHRGMKEADLILGSFAEAHLQGFDAAELDQFERLLEEDDGLIFSWVTGNAAPPPERDDPVLRRLIAFRYRPRPA